MTMKVKEVITILSCLDDSLDLSISDDGEEIVVSKDDGTDVLKLNPATEKWYTNILLGILIAGAFSAQQGEDSESNDGNES